MKIFDITWYWAFNLIQLNLCFENNIFIWVVYFWCKFLRLSFSKKKSLIIKYLKKKLQKERISVKKIKQKVKIKRLLFKSNDIIIIIEKIISDWRNIEIKNPKDKIK